MDVFALIPDDGGGQLHIPYVGFRDYLTNSKTIPEIENIPALANFSFWTPGEGVKAGFSPSLHEIAQLSQTWLFFGLLSVYFKTEFDHSEFVRGGNVVAAGSALVTIHRQFFRNYMWNPQVDRFEEEERMISLLYFVTAEIERLEIAVLELFPSESESAQWQAFAAVSLSIKLLIELLADLIRALIKDRSLSAWETDTTKPLHQNPLCDPVQLSRIAPSTRLLLENFKAQGWCPKVAEQLCRTLSYRSCSYLSKLRCEDGLTGVHEKCTTARACIAYNIKDEDYHIPHCDDCFDDQCTFVHAPREFVTDIIQSGNIPLISIKSGGSLELIVVSYTPKLRYTAISHIWSDGLGNPSSNSLRECQLHRLRAKLLGAAKFDRRKTQERIIFWMDTFCVPIPRSGAMRQPDQMLRQRAIRHISAIFANSERTLILDEVLETESVSEGPRTCSNTLLDTTTAAGYLLASTWMQRGWTLDEGSLGKRCICKFKDGYMNVHRVAQAVRPSTLSVMLSTWPRADTIVNGAMLQYTKNLNEALGKSLFGQWWDDLQTRRSNAMTIYTRLDQFICSWNGLAHRSFSRKNDSALVFANLLDFNSMKLSRVPPAERLSTIIRNCREIPLSLLYIVDDVFNLSDDHCVLNELETDWIPQHIAGDLVYEDRTESLGPSIMLQEEKTTEFETHRIASLDLGSDDRVYCFLVKRKDILASGAFSMAVSDDIWTIQAMPRNTNKLQERSETIKARIESDLIMIILDGRAGTRSLFGWSARGAQFRVCRRTNQVFEVSFESPVFAQSSQQRKHALRHLHSTNTATIPQVVGEQLWPGPPITLIQFEHRPRIFLLWEDSIADSGGRTEHSLWNFQPSGSLFRLSRRPTGKPVSHTFVKVLLYSLLASVVITSVTSVILPAQDGAAHTWLVWGLIVGFTNAFLIGLVVVMHVVNTRQAKAYLESFLEDDYDD